MHWHYNMTVSGVKELGSSPGSVIYELCDLGQITEPVSQLLVYKMKS